MAMTTRPRSVKGITVQRVLRAEFTEGLRVDRYIYHLFEFVAAEFVHRSVSSLSGAHQLKTNALFSPSVLAFSV
jgi:hypothetical protein